MDDLLVFTSGKTKVYANWANGFSGGGGPVMGFRHVQSDVKTTMIIRLIYIHKKAGTVTGLTT